MNAEININSWKKNKFTFILQTGINTFIKYSNEKNKIGKTANKTGKKETQKSTSNMKDKKLFQKNNNKYLINVYLLYINISVNCNCNHEFS